MIRIHSHCCSEQKKQREVECPYKDYQKSHHLAHLDAHSLNIYLIQNKILVLLMKSQDMNMPFLR